MDRIRQLQLWSNNKLSDYVWDQARRHFSRVEDQEDAKDEAWVEIGLMPQRATLKSIRKRAYQVINAMYRKRWRERQHCVHMKDETLPPNVHG